MKLLTLLFFLLASSYSGNTKREFNFLSKRESAQEVLQKALSKLNSLQALKYTYLREINASSQGYYHKLTAQNYIKFTSLDKVLGITYQGKSDELAETYNGSEIFTLNKKDNTIRIHATPDSSLFKHSSFLYDSPITLKNALPQIIADQSISKILHDTLINNKGVFVVEFVLERKALNAIGDYFPITMPINHVYRLIVDKASFLPLQVWHGNTANKDFTLTKFTNLEVNPSAPTQASWYYSDYLKEYTIESPKNLQLIEKGQKAPDWQLPILDSKVSTRLSQYRGKLILLEFWIAHCGYCISVIPKLNALLDKYSNKDLKLLAINTHDSKEIIDVFISNNKPSFQILHNGGEVAKRYGVVSYPSIVLINKIGEVIYSGAFNQDHIEELIKNNI
jgi:thiol-disulfide isomerase/thioredoxin